MSNVRIDGTKVITSKVRFSYLHVFEPQGINGSEPKYSVSLIIPKNDKELVAAIEKAIDNAKEAGKSGKFGGKIPTNLKTPLRYGDEDRPDDENYANSYFLNANCKTKPGRVYKDGRAIENELDLYSGCYGRASISFYAFNTNGNKGIACGLNNLQKLEDGESLGGRVSAERDFEDFLEEDEDLFN